MADTFFVGKRVLVTGAGRGIGKGIVIRLANLGATVFAMTVSDSSLAELLNINGNIHALQVNLNDWDATRKVVQSVLPIDLLVNNAGIFIGESFLHTTQESFDSTMTVNVKSVLNISQVVAKSMIEKGHPGSIVNVSSVASSIALQNHTAYCTSKAALDGLTRMMALELGDHNIRVNSLNPTVILTDMGRLGWSDAAKSAPLLKRIPLHRFGEVEDAVDAVVFLLSDRSKFISGIHLPLDGGLLAT